MKRGRWVGGWVYKENKIEMKKTNAESISASIKRLEKKRFIEMVECLFYLIKELSNAKDDLRIKVKQSSNPLLFYEEYMELVAIYDLISSQFVELEFDSELMDVTDTNFDLVKNSFNKINRELFPFSNSISMSATINCKIISTSSSDTIDNLCQD